jgi:hypothetical protein
LFLYGLVSAALASEFHPYIRVAVALTLSLGVLTSVDVVPRLLRGERPLLGTDSRLYSVRGVASLILVVLVTAVTVDLLRATTTLSENVLIVTATLVGAIVVFGPVVGYYYRRSVAQSR